MVDPAEYGAEIDWEGVRMVRPEEMGTKNDGPFADQIAHGHWVGDPTVRIDLSSNEPQ